MDQKCVSKQEVFGCPFWMSFSCILEGVWGGFGGPLAPLGEDLESPWRLLVDFWASFLGACIGNALQKGSWRVLGGSWARFGIDFGGSGRDLGTVWMSFGEGFGSISKPSISSCFGLLFFA